MSEHELTHHTFGNTGLRMPRVVFGATALGNLFVAMRDDAKTQLVRQWLTSMPRPIAIDSAGKYGAGLSLEVIGRELRNANVDPADVILSNKLGWRRIPLTGPEPTFEPGVWMDIFHDAVQDISYDGILRCHEEGVRMLGDYKPQLVSVHDPDEYLHCASDTEDRQRRMKDIQGAYRALGELRDAGEVVGVGVGAKDWKVIRELSDHCQLDWVMMANSFTIMHHASELVEFVEWLATRKVALINSAVTHGGFLTGGDFFDYRKVKPSDPQDAIRLDWRETFAGLCAKYGQSPYNVAVAFAASHPAVTSLALSTSNPARVTSMVESVSTKVPTELWRTLIDFRMIDVEYGERFLLVSSR